MAVVKKFNIAGNELEDIHIEDHWLDRRVNLQMVKDYIVALRSNRRQWGANTKTRAEVSHSGQKPHPQKGTGRARQGYLGAPQYKGGGCPKGPRGFKRSHIKINKKERESVIRYLFSNRIKGEQLIVLDQVKLNAPKTKPMGDFLKKRGWFSGKVLFLSSLGDSESNFCLAKSVRNIPGVRFMFLDKVSGYDILAHRHIILMEPALESLKNILEV